MSTDLTGWKVYDTESNGFLYEATKLHVISIVPAELGKDKVSSYYGTVIEEGLEILQQAPVIVAHNQAKHDIPLIQKLYPGWEPPLIVDSLVLSALLFPERMGGHGIDAWARRLGGEQKVQHEEWDEFSFEMLKRCESDTRLNKRVLHRLLKEAYEPIDGVPYDGFDFGEYNHELYLQTGSV